MEDITTILEKVKKEGNYEEFIYRNIPAVIIRNTSLLTLNGYFKITEDIEKILRKENPKIDLIDEYDLANNYSMIHGGFTYLNTLKGKNGLWLGFDTAHIGDIIPKYLIAYNFNPYSYDDETYKDKIFVKRQLKNAIDDFLDYQEGKNTDGYFDLQN